MLFVIIVLNLLNHLLRFLRQIVLVTGNHRLRLLMMRILFKNLLLCFIILLFAATVFIADDLLGLGRVDQVNEGLAGS